MKRFPEKRVLITGAGSGLGQALALEFAKSGWRVGIAEVDPKRTDESVKLVSENGGQGLAISCDVTRHDDLKKAAETVEKEWNGVDILINNAGVSATGYMEEMPIDRWEWIMNINLWSIIYGCREFIPILEREKGYIVNIASYLGFLSSPLSACYSTTKAGVISLSETLRIELTKKGIGVSVVLPSFFKTNLMDQLYAAGEEEKALVTALFDKANYTAERVAKCTIKGIRKEKFYILPQIDAKILWRLKRWFPEFYLKLFTFVFKKGLVEKFFGIEADNI